MPFEFATARLKGQKKGAAEHPAQSVGMQRLPQQAPAQLCALQTPPSGTKPPSRDGASTPPSSGPASAGAA